MSIKTIERTWKHGFFDLVDERDRLRTWQDESDLDRLASEVLPGADVGP